MAQAYFQHFASQFRNVQYQLLVQLNPLFLEADLDMDLLLQ